jgi:hypothetical protein
LAAYGAVTAAYWAFMLTDGALRMLVLLHFHTLGFSPVQLAYLFVLYEIAGVVTNLCAGWIAARFGLTSTLYAGLGLQIAALLALSALDPAWGLWVSVAFVMAVQGVSGVAKDLAKMSAKSAVKVLAPKTEGTLFRWVALLTGSKNAVKGLGFFMGAALLALAGFDAALWGMAAVLAVILTAVALFMPAGLPARDKGAKFTQWRSPDPRVNRLALARLFLFGARDAWFVVGVPVFLAAALSDGTDEGRRWAFFAVGGFMAVWIIAYGAVQAMAPRLVKGTGMQAAGWALALVPITGALALWMGAEGPWPVAALIVGLLVFGFVFAVNSALHSYLILSFGQASRITRDVGFYYMANAGGRLTGTLLSGIGYQVGGVTLCLTFATLMAAASWWVARGLRA